MVSNSLRQFLQSLCCNSPWDYAVFWKLQQHQNQMLLTWEDGSFDITRPREPTGDTMDSFYFNLSNEGLSSCQSDNQNKNLDDSQMGFMIAEMSSIYYIMGQGVVGEAAYSGSPSWIFADSITAGGSGFNLISWYPDELLQQFVAGIKTILLVPLVAFGVLQLGSVEKVAEDTRFVACVKNEFYGCQQLAGDLTPLMSDREFLCQPSELKCTYMESLDELTGIAINKMDVNLKILDNNLGCQKMPNTNQMMFTIQNLCEMYRRDVSGIIDVGSESKINTHSVSISDIAEHFMYPMSVNSESKVAQNMDEELDAFSFFRDHEIMHQNMTVHRIMESYSNRETMKYPVVKEDCYDDTIYRNGSQFLRFPSDSELHKALGSVSWDHTDLNLSRQTVSGENGSSICERENSHCIQPSAWDSCREFAKDAKAEYLLEAVPGNADDSPSCRSHSTTLPKASPRRSASSETEQAALAGDDRVPWSCVTSEDVKMKISAASSLNCMTSELNGHQFQRDRNSNICPAKGLKPTNRKKRREPGDSQKPRPRDRQLIQDRIKELREIVPNGAKCSIDGLLDRTIKHMQFLRRATDQADKIEKNIRKEDPEQKDLNSQTMKRKNEKGASWALEMGCGQAACPIIVKDLNYPGRMLIEMLCDDHGRFLEIADVIYRLELTILKGLMEKRSNESIWAHFIVEASGNFHRLDIFWPLMQLLQQNCTQISSKI